MKSSVQNRIGLLIGSLRRRSLPGIFSITKDAGWIVVMGIVCLATFAVSSVILRYMPTNRL